ncbi:MAG TPA: carboxypeptidase regulatory-like domain-containing protein [Gemmatimonadales bacterium]|nr:carboxypeptidase regulatory-like domain-containing protein [Gemmatimonadales bacterium]
MRYSSSLASLALVALGAAATMGARHASAPVLATITGTVSYTGTPPRMRPIDMAKEPSCAAQHTTPMMTENVVTGPNNTVANAVIYISAGAPASTAPTTVAHYDQKGCAYIPHVLAMMAGQPLEITNSDRTAHNIHPLAVVNSEWNKSTPPGSAPLQVTWAKPEFIAVKCNIHPWMHGYFAVLPTTHYAVSGADGSFSLEGLPPGTYTLTAWHEKFGTQTQQVTIGAGAPPHVAFSFKALPF